MAWAHAWQKRGPRKFPSYNLVLGYRLDFFPIKRCCSRLLAGEDLGEDFSFGIGDFEVEDFGDGGGDIQVGHAGEEDAFFDGGAGGDEDAVEFGIAGGVAMGAAVVLGGAGDGVAGGVGIEGVAGFGVEDEVAGALVLFGSRHAKRVGVLAFNDLVDAFGLLEKCFDLREEFGPAFGTVDVDESHAALGDGGDVGAGDRGSEGFEVSGLFEGDVRIDVVGDFFEAVIGGDDEGGLIGEACLIDGIDEVADESVSISERGVAGPGGGTVAVMDGVGIEGMVEEQVGLVFAKDVDGGFGPGFVAPGDVAGGGAGLVAENVVGGEDAFVDHGFFDGAFETGAFGKGVGDGFGIGDGDPVDFAGGEAFGVGEIVEGGGENHLVFVDPLFDFRMFAGTLADEETVEEDTVFARADSRDEGGVVDPGDGRIGDGHGLGGGSVGGELAKVGGREAGVFPDPGGKSIDADEDDARTLGRVGNLSLRRTDERGGDDEEGEKERVHREMILTAAIGIFFQ